jgi:DNA processing protein
VRTALALASWKGLARADLRMLLARMSPEDALKLVAREIPSGAPTCSELDRMESLSEEFGIRSVIFGGPGYPVLLNVIPDPPAVLFWRGDLGRFLASPSVAVIGSRRCTQYGRKVARTLSQDFARAGVGVVSGLARGIDGEAHLGALDAGGRTLAVLGNGPDIIYPPEHAKLAARIIANGVLLSEYPPGTEPARFRFPERNRLISGLALGLVVVEAGSRSGTMITVATALEQGREVFAVPGEVTRALSMGTNMLLRDGAGVVITSQDVLGPLGLAAPAADAAPDRVLPSEGAAGAIVKALSDGALHLDGILAATGETCGTLREELLQLELNGIVEKRPGGFYALR